MAVSSTFLSRLFKYSNVAFLAALLVVLQSSNTWACSDVGAKVPDYEYMFMWSDVVVHGQVIDVMDPEPGRTDYSVNFKVFCSYKGAPPPQYIRIDRVGPIPGMCYQTELEKGKNYLLWLKQKDEIANSYVPTFTQSSADETFLQEIVYVCGIDLQLPQGVEEAATGEDCPAPNEYPDECFPPPTGKPRPVFTTELPPPPPNKELMSPPPPPKKQPSPQPAEAQTPAKPSPENNAPYEAVQDNKKQTDPEDSAVSLSWSLLIFLPVALLHLIL